MVAQCTAHAQLKSVYGVSTHQALEAMLRHKGLLDPNSHSNSTDIECSSCPHSHRRLANFLSSAPKTFRQLTCVPCVCMYGPVCSLGTLVRCCFPCRVVLGAPLPTSIFYFSLMQSLGLWGRLEQAKTQILRSEHPKV